MKVLLVANYLPDGQASMQAFRQVLERELPRQGCEVRVSLPARRALGLSPASRWSKWLGYVDKFILYLPQLARDARWADVVHICDHSNAMYVPRLRARPTLVTCHDVIAIQAALGMVPGWEVGASGRLFQRLISRGLGQADLIGCVSQLTRRDLLKLRLADESKVIVTQNGLNADFAPLEPGEIRRLLTHLGLAPGVPYLLHVGLDLPRKNRGNVLRAFIELQRRAQAAGRPAPMERLVFVGPPLDAAMAAEAQAAGIADRVVTLQKVSHDELRALYAGAAALLFPSLQEGFGWPVIEAQACGCPVFTSDLAPMNEIGGAGAVYVDPQNPQAMATAIEQAQPQLERMRQLGLENARNYSSQQMAANYVAAYRRVIGERATGAAEGAR